MLSSLAKRRADSCFAKKYSMAIVRLKFFSLLLRVLQQLTNFLFLFLLLGGSLSFWTRNSNVRLASARTVLFSFAVDGNSLDKDTIAIVREEEALSLYIGPQDLAGASHLQFEHSFAALLTKFPTIDQ